MTPVPLITWARDGLDRVLDVGENNSQSREVSSTKVEFFWQATKPSMLTTELLVLSLSAAHLWRQFDDESLNF